MPQSLVKNLVHLVYGTKRRKPWRPDEVRDAVLRQRFDRHGIEYDERYVWD